jgi:hypothetical protein
MPPGEAEEGVPTYAGEGKGMILRRRMGIPDDMQLPQADRAARKVYAKVERVCGHDLTESFSWYVHRGLADDMIESMYHPITYSQLLTI